MTAPRTGYVPHYRPMVLRKETKRRLRVLRNSMKERGLAEERRILTAIVDMMLDEMEMHPELRMDLERRIKAVILLDEKTASIPDDIKMEFGCHHSSHA